MLWGPKPSLDVGLRRQDHSPQITPYILRSLCGRRQGSTVEGRRGRRRYRRPPDGGRQGVDGKGMCPSIGFILYGVGVCV